MAPNNTFIRVRSLLQRRPCYNELSGQQQKYSLQRGNQVEPSKTVCRRVNSYMYIQIKQSFERQSFSVLTNRSYSCMFGLSTICTIMWFLLTVSDRTKYSLQQGKWCVRTVKIYPLQWVFRYSEVRYSRVCFHIFYCNSVGLSNVVR